MYTVFGIKPVSLKDNTLPGTESISVLFRMIPYKAMTPFGFSGGNHEMRIDLESIREGIGGLCSSGSAQ